MNLIDPSSPFRIKGPEVVIQDSEEFVPLFLTGETLNGFDPRSMGYWQNRVLPKDVADKLNRSVASSKYPTIKAVKNYLTETLTMPELKSWKFTLPVSEVEPRDRNSFTWPSSNDVAKAFSGVISEASSVTADAPHLGRSNRTRYCRRGLCATISFIQERSYYPGGMKHYPDQLHAALPRPVNRLCSVEFIVMVRAKHVAKLRTRSALGLKIDLPFSDIQVLISTERTVATDFAPLAGLLKWIQDESLEAQYVSPTVINKRAGLDAYPLKMSDKEHYLASIKAVIARGRQDVAARLKYLNED